MALAVAIGRARPSGCKGKLWRSARVSSTMGPSINLDLAPIRGSRGN
jgi:ribosomal protein L1